MQTHIWWWNFPPPNVGPSTVPYGLPWDLASNSKYQQTLANRDSGVLARVSIQVNRAFYQAQVQLLTSNPLPCTPSPPSASIIGSSSYTTGITNSSSSFLIMPARIQ